MSRAPGSVEALKALERTGWSQKADSYSLLTGRITARLVEPLLDAAGVVAGMRVLDVGSGPGYVAQRATGRGAVATGIDIADEVVARARRRHTGIRFVCGDAEQLPFAESSFDALVGNFAINHLPRPERAIHEFARVVVTGGSIALSAWDAPERSGFPGILVDALRVCGVTDARDGVAGTNPYRFAEDDEFCELLSGAGLGEVEVRSESLSHPVRDVNELWRGLLGGSVRTAELVMRQPPPARRRIRAAVERLAEEYRADGELAIPVRAKIALGTTP